jgi:DNA-binding NtrC family response regulator
LIPLACSALGADLIQSTVRALAANPLGDRAARSTLLLNEVDRLPPEVHAELADVLSARSFLPRLVATAERPLDELVGRGQYRSDLAAVLGTLLIEVPPLARRREDLPLLAQMFLEEANTRGSHQVGGFSPEALDRLDAYPWPGNVDELAQMVAQAYGHAEGAEIAVGDLPKRIHQAAEAAAHPRPVEEPIQLDSFLAEIERELIHRALAQAKGNKAKAARLLGLTRPRLYRRMVQLGLEEE